MTACRYCGHDPEPATRSRALDPNWRPCPTCRASTWKVTASGSTKCGDCDHGYVPRTDHDPTPPPHSITRNPALPAQARAALRKDNA